MCEFTLDGWMKYNNDRPVDFSRTNGRLEWMNELMG